MRIASILLPLPLPEPFDYSVPDDMAVDIGGYVRAPLGPHERVGVIWALQDAPAGSPASQRTLKALTDIFPVPPMPEAMRKFIDFSARYNVVGRGAVLSMALRARGGLSHSPVQAVYALTNKQPERMTPAREKVLSVAADIGVASASVLADAAGFRAR